MNTTELKKVMLDHNDKNSDLAKYLGMSESTFSTKLHERGLSFRKCEIKAIADRYKLTAEQIQNIFFAD